MVRFYGTRLSLFVLGALVVGSSGALAFSVDDPGGPVEMQNGRSFVDVGYDFRPQMLSAFVSREDRLAPTPALAHRERQAIWRNDRRDVAAPLGALRSAAVQPSSIAGWRSGRVKRLAG